MEELATANNAIASFFHEHTAPFHFSTREFVTALSKQITVRTGMCRQCGVRDSILAVKTVPSNYIIYDTGAHQPQCFLCSLNEDTWDEDYAAWKEAVDSATEVIDA